LIGIAGRQRRFILRTSDGGAVGGKHDAEIVHKVDNFLDPAGPGPPNHFPFTRGKFPPPEDNINKYRHLIDIDKD
jgi:hypothetical protein